MARRRRPQPTPTTSSAVTPSPAESQLVSKRHFKELAKRFVDSAVDKAFELFWLGVITVMTPIGIALWLYIKSGRATWVYPYLNFALGFICACLFLIVAASLLFYLKARRRKAAEQAKNARFISDEKGYLDHRVNLNKSNNEFISILVAIGNEYKKLGETSSKEGVKIDAAAKRGAEAQLRAASKTAAKFNKHSEKLAQLLANLESLYDLMSESSIGYLRWLTSQPALDEQQLNGLRESLVVVIDSTRNSVATTSNVITAAEAVRGISQDLNTAINRLSHVTDGIVTAMRKWDTHWQELMRIIDRRLRR